MIDYLDLADVISVYCNVKLSTHLYSFVLSEGFANLMACIFIYNKFFILFYYRFLLRIQKVTCQIIYR